MKKTIYLLFSLLLITVAIHAQRITNKGFLQDGNTLIINYELRGLGEYKNANVELYLSTDGGRTFQGPLKAVSGDVGKVESDGVKSITWRVFEEYSILEGSIVFDVRAEIIRLPIPAEYFLAYNASETSAVGLTFGSVGRWGWYVRAKSNASFMFSDYTTDGEWITNYDGQGYYTYTNKMKNTRIAATAGVISRLGESVYFYAGAGYGIYTLFWNAEEFSYNNHEKTRDIWAEHKDWSYKNAELETGLMFRIGKISFSIGVNTIGFEFYEVNGGVGVFF